MVKKYVLDTNILMSTEGKAIYGFDDNNIIIPAIVLEELDNLKTSYGEKGFQAREAIRTIEEITERSAGDMSWNIPGLEGILTIVDVGQYKDYIKDIDLPAGFNLAKPDNIIIETALLINSKDLQSGKRQEVTLVTNDVSMRIKALACNIKTQSYRNDQVDSDFAYSGRNHIQTDRSLESLFDTGIMDPPDDTTYHEHEYFHVTNGTSSALCKYEAGKLVLLPDYNKNSTFGIFPKNQGQRYALDALLAPADEIPLVILKGPAGTGKTLLSLAAALSQTYTNFNTKKKNKSGYDKIVCARANVLADAEIGYLPGDVKEKTLPLLASIVDNLTYLIGNEEEDKEQVSIHIDDMFDTEIIEVTSLAYIRGRSLPNTYIIIDEAQNLTRLQAKTIITRVGMGTKIVFMGDLNQIDSPKLDKRNNGLAYLSEKFMGNKLCAQVEFLEGESVRSPLAAEAINLL